MKSYATNVWNNWLFLYTSPHGSSGYISPAQNQKYAKVKQWPTILASVKHKFFPVSIVKKNVKVVYYIQYFSLL